MKKFEVSGDAWRRRRGFRVKPMKAVRLDGYDLCGWLNGGIVADRLHGGKRGSASHRAVGNTGLVIIATLLVRTVSHRHFRRHRLMRGSGSGRHSKRHQQHCKEQDQSCDQRGHRRAFRTPIQFGQRQRHVFASKKAPQTRPGRLVAEAQQLQFLQVQGLQRQAAPAEHPQFCWVFCSSRAFISRLLFPCCSKRANHHIASVPWYRVKTRDP